MTDIIPILQNAIVADPTITALVGTRCYPAELPDAATYPAIVLTKVSGFGEKDMAGDIGLEDGRVQVDVFAEGYQACVDLAGVVRDFICADDQPGPACVIQFAQCINDVDLPAPKYERAGPRLRRRMMEFRIWARRF